MKTGNQYLIFLLCSFVFLTNCKKDTNNDNLVISNYNGSYKNIEFSESLLKEFTPGIYEENEIPEDLKQLTHGRIEIDFRYDGGGLVYFMPLFYYGSINKNNNDNAVEEPKFHLAIEIGHYNVIPTPVEYLFYTICTFNYPQYCRDTYLPITSGENYTVVIDKRPEGMILQLKQGDSIINIFPHAFFPDSIQMFFKDVTSYTDMHKGDSLKKVLMVGKGFAGIDKGIHDFNGQVSSVRIYKYIISGENPEYELQKVRNQHSENQQVNYTIKDNLNGDDKRILAKYEFWPYKFESGVLLPNGEMKTGESKKIPNNKLQTYNIVIKDIGFYKIQLQTFDTEGNILGSTVKPFEVWVYPKEWEFEFYK